MYNTRARLAFVIQISTMCKFMGPLLKVATTQMSTEAIFHV